MENKNTIIALVLMLAVWVGFSVLFPAEKPQAPLAPAQEQRAAVETEAVAAPVNPVASPVGFEDAGAVHPERELVVETDHYLAIFTSSGARLKSLALVGFRASADTDSPPISLIDAPSLDSATLRTAGTEGFSLSSEANYALSSAETQIRLSGQDSRQVVFSTVTPGGLKAEKIYTFYGDRFQIDLQVRMTNGTGQILSGGVALSMVQPWEESLKGSHYDFVGPATLVGEEIHTDDVEDLEEDGAVSYGKDLVWTGFETKYFMSAAVPLGDGAQGVRIQKTADAVENILETPRRTLQAGEVGSFEYLIYFGPRDVAILKEVGHQLALAIDFGFFGVIARPLHTVLKFFYSFFGNYGVSIILLTVIIKMLFWPLTQKSYTSMKEMQKLQPQMQKIREKFKNDRDRLNREIMGLYKEHRVNPLGGCLPMLIQIPVFFALYKVLLGTIELRHAPFALWITDLSVKDPYYITPIIMGATMFIQQKMTPSSMDPTQAKMFMLMPVVFTFLFLNFPAGLVLYWLVNNLLTIAQQVMIHRKA